MSVILSYSDNTTGAGWIPKDPYSGDDIQKISDPNGDTVEHPRTAIPSPFAQVDLVLTAFETLATTSLHSGAAMHHRLVSDALDIAQIIFDFPNHARNIRVLRWNPETALQAMELGSEAHKLLANTLRLYMQSDDAAYNFSLAGDWYILMYDGIVIGSTSPATLTMGAPGLGTMPEIMVEQGRPLFGEPRHLYERDDEFVLYLVHWLNAYPQVRKSMPGLYAYLLANLEVIRTRKPALHSRILERVQNPQALNMQAAEALAEMLIHEYSEPTSPNSPRIFGVPMLTRRAERMLDGPAESDFLLKPVLPQPKGELLPLILREGFTPPGAGQFKYINGPWQTATKVDTHGLPPEKRILPDTSITYPWLTASDLLEDSLIELSTPISRHFFTGRPADGSCRPHCLLPIKDIFFKYFPASYLTGEVVPGRRAMEMRENADGITAILRIPTAKSYVELIRNYRPLPSDTDPDTLPTDTDGIIIPDCRLSTAIFPFARTGERDIYNVRLFEMLPNYEASLHFYASGNNSGNNTGNNSGNNTGNEEAVSCREPFVRTRSKVMRTMYYEVDSAWDYARLAITPERSGSRSHSGVILPLWPQYRGGVEEFTFAVDFGTTNSHVEYCMGDKPPVPLTFDSALEGALVATLDEPGSLAQADTLLDVEFIPRIIGDDYGFPMRTALARNAGTDARPEALRSVNIPFLYERKPFNGYRVSTMLKWSEEQTEAEQFLREIMLLIRARVILHSGSLSRCKLLYFYPVSMKRSLQHRYLTLWEDLYSRYIASGEPQVTALPESVAPAFFYHNSATDGSDYVAIDIGGGSSDVVIYKADEERLHSHPEIIASFRFAGNALFGDAFTHADAASNQMLARYVSYFSRLLGDDASLSYLNVILGDIMSSGRSEDINAFLFSIEQAPELRRLSELDRRPYSYNSLLSADASLKIIFLYFHTALIYYVAMLMKRQGIGMPRRICFSGTGSKILNIPGRHALVEEFTQAIIEGVYGRRYKHPQRFELMIERERPKQVTCKGGLELARRLTNGEEGRADYSPRNIMACKSQYTLTEAEAYTFSSIRTREVRSEIEKAVMQFNDFFLELLREGWAEEFGVTAEALDKFSKEASRDIPNYLAAGIRAFLPLTDNADERVEDVPFFYALTGIIRNTLIPLFANN